MKKQLIITLVLGFILSASAFAANTLDLKDETAKISYSLGYQIGGDFKTQGVGLNADAVVQGIEDAIASTIPKIPQKEMTKLLVSLKQQVVAVQRQQTFQNTKEYLAANLKKKGVKKLPGGSQYRVLKSGSGASPALEDTVDIRFRSSRIDGSAVASNYTKGNSAQTYPLKKMLPGLRQALLKMNPGSKWEVFIPPSGRTESMQSGGVLIYEIELVAIHPASGKGS